MSRKHFESLAKAIRNSLEAVTSVDDKNAIKLTALNVARVCGEHNANFDMHRFLVACGVEN